ncbi:hypothetical protein BLNAU_4582 [Blattamonas nauphoetae]|uniref:DDB1- and CUL4-associated factor 12 beta-propeller domain-containing protein n=1 Tax=Blattamonas nauphoetae TaxID=2049346 RepID=A0ABQ9Y9I8_9EUKA|nr:hypothetical protein BLNAU_4582 [Blattamonas nauphoetae]
MNSFHSTAPVYSQPIVNLFLNKQILPYSITETMFYPFLSHQRMTLVFPTEIPSELIFDKVFCSCWISDTNCIFGTKDGQLLSLDSATKSIVPIKIYQKPERKTSFGTGMHAMKTNSTKTLLATTSSSPNELTVYTLPDMKPVCSLRGFDDCIFGCAWMNSQHLTACGRDGTFRVFDLPHHLHVAEKTFHPPPDVLHPVWSSPSQTGEMQRVLVSDPQCQGRQATITQSHRVNLWNVGPAGVDRLTKVSWSTGERVPLTLWEIVTGTWTERTGRIAIGSYTHLALMDYRENGKFTLYENTIGNGMNNETYTRKKTEQRKHHFGCNAHSLTLHISLHNKGTITSPTSPHLPHFLHYLRNPVTAVR